MTRRLRRIALVTALATVPALGAGSSQAHAAAGMELALQDDPVFVTESYVRHSKGFQLLNELKVKWIRVNVGWSAVMPLSQAKAKSKPSTVKYDFTAYDALINAARQRGIQIEASLTGAAPAWATGNKRIGPDRPNSSRFAEFVNAAVAHFGGNVVRYSIWNEPNHVGWLAPIKSQAALYRKLYVAGYNAIRKANPAAQVLIGETAPYASRSTTATAPLKFLRDLTKSGSLKADGYAHHPYDLNGNKPSYKFPGNDNVTIGTLSRLTKALDGLASRGKLNTPGGQPLDVYLTEFGYLRSGRKAVKESTRATWVRQAYDIALKNPRVRQMLHFLLAEPGSKYKFFDTSITSRSGGKTATFNSLAKWASDNAAKIATR